MASFAFPCPGESVWLAVHEDSIDMQSSVVLADVALESDYMSERKNKDGTVAQNVLITCTIWMLEMKSAGISCGFV